MTSISCGNKSRDRQRRTANLSFSVNHQDWCWVKWHTDCTPCGPEIWNLSALNEFLQTFWLARCLYWSQPGSKSRTANGGRGPTTACRPAQFLAFRRPFLGWLEERFQAKYTPRKRSRVFLPGSSVVLKEVECVQKPAPPHIGGICLLLPKWLTVTFVGWIKKEPSSYWNAKADVISACVSATLFRLYSWTWKQHLYLEMKCLIWNTVWHKQKLEKAAQFSQHIVTYSSSRWLDIYETKTWRKPQFLFESIWTKIFLKKKKKKAYSLTRHSASYMEYEHR